MLNGEVSVAIIVVVGWVISVCFHEFAHALVAYIGGDKSVKEKGYLYFNPFAYTDIRLSIILPTVFILLGGIGLPGASVQIREDQLHHRYWSSLVSAAGPFATFLFAAGLALVILSKTMPILFLVAFCWLLTLEIIVLFLNLLPVPGLDGFGIIEPFMSRGLRARLKPLYKYGFVLVIALLWVIPGPNALLWRSAFAIINGCGIPMPLVQAGAALYDKGSKPVAIVVLIIAAIAYFLRERFDWHAKCEKLMRSENYEACLAELKTILAKSEDARAYKMQALCYAGMLEKHLKDSRQDSSPDSVINSNASSAPSTENSRATSEQNLKALAAENSGSGSAPAQQQSEPDNKTQVLKTNAYTAMDKCLALQPKLFENWFAKGLICESAGDTDLAQESFEKSLSLNNDFSPAFARMCNLFWMKRKYQELLDICQKRLEQLPGDAESQFQCAVALTGLKRYDEAVELFEKCIQQGIHVELSRKNKGIILAQLERKKV